MPTTIEQQTITELLSHLVRMPTVSGDQATNRAALDWVQEQLKGLPLHIKRYEHNGFPSLVATTRRTRNPRLWLLAHIDVVPGAPHTFTPVIKKGRLYGRGVYDMKFAIAVFIALLQELGSDLTGYDLGLMITSDEEVGGYNGVKWLFDQQGYRGRAVFVPDSGGRWEMELGSKGVMWCELTATGRTAHASRPWEGINAIDNLIRFVDQVRTRIVSEPCGDPNHAHTTLNLASISGGNATNKIPDEATARLDIRIAPGTPLSEVTAWIDEAHRQVPAVEANIILADPAYQVANDAKAIELLRQIIKDVTGHTITGSTAHGSSDSRHIAPYGIPTLNVCPTGSGFHVPEEWVDLADLDRFYEVTRRLVSALANRG